MTNILAIVIMSGATCISPVEQSDALRLTIAGKTPCAIVIRAPVANPFKLAQQPNEISTPPVKVAPKKVTRCNGGKVIWFKKNGKRRYRCG